MNEEGETITSYRLERIEEALKQISENLKSLTTLEQKHIETRDSVERAFTQIGEQEKRLRAIEIELPTLTLIRNWVIAGVVGCVALIGAAVFKILFMPGPGWH